MFVINGEQLIVRNLILWFCADKFTCAMQVTNTGPLAPASGPGDSERTLILG